MAQLKPHNSVFQDELIAIEEAYTWASQSNQPIKIWTDSESSLHLLFKNQQSTCSGYSKHPSQLQILNSTGLKRMWDMRVTRQQISSQRKVPWKGFQHNIQHPGASQKRNFMSFPSNSGRMNGTTVTLEGTSFERSRLLQLRGKDQKSCLQRDIVHSQLTLRNLASETPIAIVVASSEALFT
ncbi:hypothetical protein AVEN_12562-1 [Araneus ventricosus]|uniref:RNase H type-1 domain-containing protein n=1 Tax=Araneus ventricosus TaxID=182803 RepID=A0A4Y2ACC5_ARAVE|nr:hypothetical protein AVEN_12562-1 [Araneus ventricosus]